MVLGYIKNVFASHHVEPYKDTDKNDVPYLKVTLIAVFVFMFLMFVVLYLRNHFRLKAEFNAAHESFYLKPKGHKRGTI
jgi:uncharacterized BrkB/YihY/UPF0761 family membrane protein